MSLPMSSADVGVLVGIPQERRGRLWAGKEKAGQRWISLTFNTGIVRVLSLLATLSGSNDVHHSLVIVSCYLSITNEPTRKTQSTNRQ